MHTLNMFPTAHLRMYRLHIVTILHKCFQCPRPDSHDVAIFRDSAKFQKLRAQQSLFAFVISLVLKHLEYRIPEQTGLRFLHESVQRFLEGSNVSKAFFFLIVLLDNKINDRTSCIDIYLSVCSLYHLLHIIAIIVIKL